MLLSSGIQRRLVRMRIHVSEEYITSIFRVENQPSKKQACSRWLDRILQLPPDMTLFSCSANFSTLKMEVIRFSETSVNIQTTWRYIPEDCNIQEANHLSGFMKVTSNKVPSQRL
jgi:hypothetical protein